MTGRTTIHSLEQITGRSWAGLHLWPITFGTKVYLCTPGFPELHVWDRELNRVTTHPFPHEKPAVYGGFVEPTWRGGNDSLDGEPHHFLGSWTVFDPETRRFSRLDFPVREVEDLRYLMSDYCAIHDGHLYLLAVNQKPPRTAIVLQTRTVA